MQRYFTWIGCLVALATTVPAAIAQSPKENGQSSAEFPALPPGWTAEDMQACILAGTPGEMHKKLAEGVGTWRGKSTMWMMPGGEPMHSESIATVTPIMDGRYFRAEMKGEMPGMGPYHGFGIYGYDNVSKEFVATWIDNHSTGIMNGTGELSEDGKTLSWDYTFNCPLTKKPTALREVETVTGPGTKVMEMYATDPKSGQEYKMMRVELEKIEQGERAGGQ